jgi:hypothetical protein
VRLPNTEHEAHPWVIAQVAPDFKLLDAWELPAEGGPDEFAALIEITTTLDPTNGDSRATRALFSLRFRLGRWFGWDDATSKLPVPGRTETTLSARVPEDLRDTATRPLVVSSTTFIPLYRTDDEWAAELSNRTVHAVLHLAWIDQGKNLYRGQMGVYVKPRGRFGATYMALIGPFRHLIVYPALMRQIEGAWEARPA